MTSLETDRFSVELALGVTGLLREFNQAGLLSPSDVHVARRLTELSGTEDEAVALGAAFAARAPRLGHVCVDLATVRGTASADTEQPVPLDTLPWPNPVEWASRMTESNLVGRDRPLHLEGTTLYLDRLWTDEGQVAIDLALRAESAGDAVDLALLRSGLTRLFAAGPEPDLQKMAAATAVLRRFSVVAGGPGTGKTTTVARVLALLDEQAAAAGRRLPLVALAAPTGKAAARLEEAVRAGADMDGLDDTVRERLRATKGMTLHRLLGRDPGTHSRFRHHAGNRLAHDVVVVDETSMVSLSLMARLLEAVRPEARLILVGDPEQLASVEAGAVLGDIVGPAARGLQLRPPARALLADVVGQPVPADAPEEGAAMGDGIVVLRAVHRYGGTIAGVAQAIEQGQASQVLELLASGDPNVQWIQTAASDPGLLDALGDVRAVAVDTARRVIAAATIGDARNAIAALGDFRLLCAHRRGPEGVSTFMAHIESWLRAGIEGFAANGVWYVGRPVLVTENDYGLRLYNGDTGVAVTTPSGRLVAAFDRGDEILEVSPTRLAAVDAVYAMTVHKSQGSQFGTVAVVLPSPDSPILTRELLYTAVTRARERLVVVGTEESIVAAVERPIARASGLRRALWGSA